jgi:site-specific recombinase XerD
MREADEEAWHAYERSLRQRNLSAETITNYRLTLAKLSAALPDTGLLGATAGQLEAWLGDLAADPATSAASLATWFRRTRTYYTWAARMEYLDGPSPMTRMRPPREDSREIPVPDVADIAAVLAATAKSRDFCGRRDLAMMRLLLETGTPRAAAIASLLKDRVDLRRDQVTVTDKGSKERTIPIGAKTAHALTLYLKVRASHSRARDPHLFLGKRGPMTRDGVYQVIADRCRQAGIPVISPHKWRHFTADTWFGNGGSEGDAMALFGWASPVMAHRYARANAARRAQDHAREAALADRI